MSDQNEPQQPKEPESGAEQTPASAAVPAQSGKKAERPSPRPDVSYTPVSNGMDYLVSVFQHLTEGEKPPGARDLKYAVLHLQAATEVLLKARLSHEHFSLIFQNPAEATHETWESGKFKSCGTLDAYDRLRGIARLALDDDSRKRIKELGESRNALQHYGLTHNAYAIESRAVKVLDFLLTFINRHLIPGLDGAEAQDVERTMQAFRLQLKGIETLVKQRMNALQSDLAKVTDVTVQCPDCEQWALVTGNGEKGLTCLFCDQDWRDPDFTATNYVWIVLGLDDSPQDGGDPSVVDCPECQEPALVPTAVTAASRPGTSPLCFSCGATFENLIDCEGGCGTVLDIAPDGESIPMCRNCIDIRYARF
ncbi:hypothetical protein ACFUC2_04755 [[Kitasatospora] papulosa]|uniref:hypothetical protein n=1 Tax=Streptomyces TaxID=1883 RepID=UPI00331D5022